MSVLVITNRVRVLISSSATVAGDTEVRVFDHTKAGGSSRHTGEMEYGIRESVIRILRCHKGRTKRIVTEDSPDLFLTVAEVCAKSIP